MANKLEISPTATNLSLTDIKNVVFGSSYPNTNLNLNTLSSQVGVDTQMNSFRGYYVEVSTNSISSTYGALGVIDTVDVSVTGGSGLFDTSSNELWCSTIDDNIAGSFDLILEQNDYLVTRYATIKVAHSDNPDCYVNYTVTQTTGIVKFITTTSAPKLITTTSAPGGVTVSLDITVILAAGMSGYVNLETSGGFIVSSQYLPEGAGSYTAQFNNVSAGTYRLNFNNAYCYDSGQIVTTRNWSNNNLSWNPGGITENFSITTSNKTYFGRLIGTV